MPGHYLPVLKVPSVKRGALVGECGSYCETVGVCLGERSEEKYAGKSGFWSDSDQCVIIDR